MKTTKIRWGILSTGRIAGHFAQAVSSMPDSQLIAVGSRSLETGRAFAEEFGVPHVHSSYESLAADPDVDAIYVATPHPMHKDNSILCLSAGKAVLCEKPFTLNAREADAVIELARLKKLFLMEAMWTRFLPGMAKVRELIAGGVIGEPRMVMADFGFRANLDPRSRLFDPQLGGGSLLDVGVYCVSLASMIFGKPSRIAGLAALGTTGVDEQAGWVLGYDNGRLAVLSSAVRTHTQHEAWIHGTTGSIKIHAPWYAPKRISVLSHSKEEQVIDTPFDGNGFPHQITEANECIRAGRLESEILPLQETRDIMETLDGIRSQWGMTYPSEK
ncbi:MAG: Gfo/Idh/MocA family oxidoreductase [Anaerolineae bacterium]|nr:Gfo/Idh/MocA family oxidoreductase [Thermoflexales bacterium]MDW8407151.1 Gfo/Idh/MocA family oxidoreductase [Anaerolineae bacterium]